MDETLLVSRSVWHGLVEPGSYGKAVDRAGLQVRLLDHGFAASVICPATQSGAAALSLGQRHLRDGMSILPMAPDQFFIESATALSSAGLSGAGLASAGLASAGLASEGLARLFGAEATVIDQTGSRASLQLSGPNVLDVLAKGVMIDCDPRAFPPGSGRVTLLGALSIQISVDADAVFELSCMRSMAGDLWHWVETAAGPYGIAVSR